LARELGDQFIKLVNAEGLKEAEWTRELAQQLPQLQSDPKGLTVFKAHPDIDGPTIADTFKMLWAIYEECAGSEKLLATPKFVEGRPSLGSAVRKTSAGISFAPYALPHESKDAVPATLEGFFSFYDLIEYPILRSLFAKLQLPQEIDVPQVSAVQQDFRSLRQIALRTAYDALAPFKHKPTDYLAPLFTMPGPFGYPAICTLNFDLAIERCASDRGLTIFDGFSDGPRRDLPIPSSFEQAESANLVRLWDAARSNLCPYIGFECTPTNSIELIKLHGSIGWFTIEEGCGDIGNRRDLRQNVAYAHMRLPSEAIAVAGLKGEIQDLADGGASDIAMQSKDGPVSRKAGAVWLRPNMVFARATKMRSDPMWVELFGRFSLALTRAKNILVVGYSWGDVHINDALLNAVAQGTRLIDVSRNCPSQHTLGLIAQRFPTTFRETSTQVFMFGGGTRRVIAEQKLVLPSGDEVEFNLPAALNEQIALPSKYSLRYSLPK
jgi:hypothetical protein